MDKNVKRIGIISDTHGLLRDEAVHALRGSDLIIHAGDVGGPEIIETLKQIAPVVAVRGNTDHDAWGKTLPVTAVAEAGSGLIYVIHDIHELDIDPAGGGFQMVVSGHSHKPSKSERDGVTYLNPGSAGPRRFQLPVAIARLDLSLQPWRIEFVNIMKFESGGSAAR